MGSSTIEHDYIRIIKDSVFQAMGSSTGVGHERQEVSSTVSSMVEAVSSRVEGSNPVRGKFFAEFFFL